MRNLITDVPGLKVGHAEDIRLGSGSTAVIFEEPAVASIDLRGGGPGTRETALLDPAQTVEGIDAIALSGGSAFGLDAASGVQAWLREQGRGFAVRTARVPIVPAAILFDLLSGGNKDWGRYPPYREFGYAAAASAGAGLCAGQRRRRHRRDHGELQRRHRLGIGAKPGRLHRRRARGGERRWQRFDRQRSLVLGRALRTKRRIRRPRPAAAVPTASARAAHQGRHAREHDARRRRHRRDH